MAPHILAVLIFVVMFVLIVLDKIERQYVSLGCGLLMIVLVFGLGMHSKDAIVDAECEKHLSGKLLVHGSGRRGIFIRN